MDDVIVVGAGLAGLAAAVALAQADIPVTLLESKTRLGGRAGSFEDPRSGLIIDACQHVSMGCCTNFQHFCDTIGVGDQLIPQPVLYFMTPDGRVSPFRSDPWPAPLHLGRALAGAHYLTPWEKVRIGYGLLQLIRQEVDFDPPLQDWLLQNGQTQRTIDRFWSVVLTSALNETIARVGVKYARKVFWDGFVRHRDGFTVHVPAGTLADLYGDALRHWLSDHAVDLRENASVRGVSPLADGSGWQVQFRNGETRRTKQVVLALPFGRVLDLLPEQIAEQSFFARIGQLQPSPISSVHLWWDRPVLDHPHLVLIDTLSQWIFSRGEVAPGEYYLQVVVSAARELRSQGHDHIQSAIVAELRTMFPKMREAELLRCRVVTETAATFSAVPGVDDFRPPQETPLAGLFLAGDWTKTGWPATMEGAVRSGYLAAEAITRSRGLPQKFVQPELGQLP